MSDRWSNDPSVAIIGGGPAGLSAARLLRDAGLRRVTVFEAQDRVGGKSLSLRHDGLVHEMGTCYSTLAYRTTNRWMRKLGIRQRRLGKQVVDGRPFVAFANEAPGGDLLREGLRYLELWREHQRRLKETPDDPAFIAECAEPLSDWLDKHEFISVRRFMLRAVTSIGYGFLDEISTCQALRWCTPRLILTGLLNQLKMPEEGWQIFWERLAQDMDVRRGVPVIGLERRNDGAVVSTALDDEHFDHVVVTIPMDELAAITRLNETEQRIAEAIDWYGYNITLCRVDDWFTDAVVEIYSEALEVGSPTGRLLSARRSVGSSAGGEKSPIYLTGQYAGPHSEAVLFDQLKTDIAARGARLRHAITHRCWKYFPRYNKDAIRDGLLADMRAVQGQARTWFSGATFSHEAVANIVDFNHELVSAMVPRLKAAH